MKVTNVDTHYYIHTRARRWVLLGVAVLVALTAAGKRFTLVIDAGHGGHDAGAVGAVTKEKAINLNVALAFGRLVEQHCPDVNVVYTRKTDVFVPLHTRADIANKAKADLFVSIHTNSLPKGRISRGMETYTLGMHRAADNLEVAKRENEVILYEKDYRQRYQGFDPNSAESYIMFEFIQDHNMAQSVEMAKCVQRRTCAAAGRQNKGVKQAGFLVLRETSMPSCLIELGFISTADEEQFLNSPSGVSQLGRGIYQAFVDYKQKYAPGGSVPYKAEPQEDISIQRVVPQQEDKKPKAAVQPKDKKPQAEDKKPKAEPKDTVAPTAQQLVAQQPVAQHPAVRQSAVQTDSLVFKVQVLASATRLKPQSPQLQGLTDVQCYEEGGLYKYTVGASADYGEMYRLRKELSAKFPQCFVVAFRNGGKTDIRQAIQEYKKVKR